MRNLTIKRNKSFVGCACRMKVYIADAEQGDLVINGENCRKLGNLKNGEEKTFTIGNEKANVYVIGDKMSRNLANGSIAVPAGEDDVRLSGKNILNPGLGNPFEFDAAPGQHRGKGNRKRNIIGWIFMIAIVLVGCTFGRGVANFVMNREASPKDFSASGMTVTLTDDFKETSYEGFTACYEANDAAVMMTKEPFAMAAGFENVTLEQYGSLILSSVQGEVSPLETKNGVLGFTYEYPNPENKTTYSYYVTMYKSSDAFWLIQYSSLQNDFKDMLPEFEKYAQSVKFE